MKKNATKNPEPDQDGGTRERIVLAAKELFASQGFSNTSTRAIAAKAGCNLSLIQYYFGSKEGLLEEIVKRLALHVRGELERLLRVEGTPELPLERFVDFIVDFLRENYLPLQIFFKVYIAENRAIPEGVAEVVRGNADRAQALIQAFQEAGLARTDLNPRLCAMLLMSTIIFPFVSGPVAQAVMGPRNDEFIAHFKRHIREVFLYGVTGSPGGRK